MSDRDGVVRAEFGTTDQDVAEDFLRRTYGPSRLGTVPAGDGFTLDHSLLGAPGFAVNTLRIGVDLITDAGPVLDDVVLVVQPVHGRVAYVDSAYPDAHAAAGDAVLAPPTGPMRALCERFEVTLTPLDRSRVAGHAAATTGIEPDDLVFDGLTPLTPALGRYWADTVAHVRSGVLAEPWAAGRAILLDRAFRCLATALLSVFPNSALARATAPEAPPLPTHMSGRRLREIVEYLDAHAHLPLGPAEIAAVAGVPAAAAADALRRRHGTSPAEVLWAARLRGVRRELLDADPEGPGATIADIATHWGFPHLGAFRVAYTRAFDGDTPEQTLLRSAP